MIKGPEFIRAVDAFMPMEKAIGGLEALSWRPARQGEAHKVCVKLPLEVDGEFREEHRLLLSADPDQDRLVFSVGILFMDWCVCRLDFDEFDSHGNHWHPTLPSRVKGPHWHSWELNRPLFKKLGNFKRLEYAEPFTAARRFDATLRWYCAERRIHIGGNEIPFPPRGGLL